MTGASPGMARQLSDFARDLQAEPDLKTVLKRIVEAAVAEVEGAQHAGISLVERDKILTEAPTDELVVEVDKLQYAAGEGPCLSTIRDEATVRSGDLRTDGRWPTFGKQAAELGVRSMLSVQLFVTEDNLGALNMYADSPDAFTPGSEDVALLFASHAAIAMKGAQTEADLRTALASRDVIGQAKGILMERFKITPSQAFDMLIAVSHHYHRKLHEVADSLAASGELPG